MPAFVCLRVLHGVSRALMKLWFWTSNLESMQCFGVLLSARLVLCLELIKKEYKIYMQDIINSMNTSEQLI